MEKEYIQNFGEQNLSEYDHSEDRECAETRSDIDLCTFIVKLRRKIYS
jgi:hypothetical protein